MPIFIAISNTFTETCTLDTVATNDKQGTEYILNVCGAIHVACSPNKELSAQSEVAVCQTSKILVGFIASLVKS